MEAELQDLNSQESKDEASLAKVKKQLRDLEAKVKDQEEELDEQAGTIQMLEQVIKHTYTITFFLSWWGLFEIQLKFATIFSSHCISK